MKLNVSNELKSRLTHAAENGSVIAKDILSEVKKNVPVEEIIRGPTIFSTKRKRTEAGTFKKIRIVFTACNKDLGPSQFPGPEQSAGTLVSGEPDRSGTVHVYRAVQNLGPYHPMKSTISAAPSRWTAKSQSGCMTCMNDFFMGAYLESNYSPISDGTIQPAQLLYGDMKDKGNATRISMPISQGQNTCGKDDSSNVVGRAIVWNEITLWKSINTPIAASLLDRIYSSHAFVIELIRKQAGQASCCDDADTTIIHIQRISPY